MDVQPRSATGKARILVDELITNGVSHAVLCPGSRSAPLAFALHEAERAGKLQLHVRIDERSAGFLAVGIAKATGVAGDRGLHVRHRGGEPAPRRARSRLRQGAVDRPDRGPAGRDASCGRQPDREPARHARDHDLRSAPRALRERRRDVALARVPGGRPRPGSPSGARQRATRRTAGPRRRHLADVFAARVDAYGLLDDDGGGAAACRPARPDTGRAGRRPAGPARGRGGARLAGHRRADRGGRPARRGPPAGPARFPPRSAPTRWSWSAKPTLARSVRKLLGDTPLVHVVGDAGEWADTQFSAAVATTWLPEGPVDLRWKETWQRAAHLAGETIDGFLAEEGWPTGLHVARDLVGALPPGAALFVGASNAIRDVDFVAPRRNDVRVYANRGWPGSTATPRRRWGWRSPTSRPTHWWVT